MITGYDLQKNTYSDQRFAQDTITKLTVEKDENTLLIDGAYFSEEINKKAKARGIKMFLPILSVELKIAIVINLR